MLILRSNSIGNVLHCFIFDSFFFFSNEFSVDLWMNFSTNLFVVRTSRSWKNENVAVTVSVLCMSRDFFVIFSSSHTLTRTLSLFLQLFKLGCEFPICSICCHFYVYFSSSCFLCFNIKLLFIIIIIILAIFYRRC